MDLITLIKEFKIQESLSLIKESKDLNCKDAYGCTALMISCSQGLQEITKELIQRGADVNILSTSGNSALIYTCKYGDYEMSKLLIDNGANVNIQTRLGSSPLMFASAKGFMDTKYSFDENDYIKIVVYLIEKGADINCKDTNGNTALIHACKFNYLDIVSALLACKADKNLKNNEGKSAYSYANSHISYLLSLWYIYSGSY